MPGPRRGWISVVELEGTRGYRKGMEGSGTYAEGKVERKGVRVQTLVQKANKIVQADKWWWTCV